MARTITTEQHEARAEQRRQLLQQTREKNKQHRILVTGASGYLGGTLLARWSTVELPPFDKLFALVRSEEHANAVKQYGAEPLTFDAQDESAVREAVLSNKISIVFFLIDAVHVASQTYFIKALAEVKQLSGLEIHFIHVGQLRLGRFQSRDQFSDKSPKTSGAKLFSSHAGAPIDEPFQDTEPDLYEIQKSQVPLLPAIRPVSLKLPC
jgi:hypothetical protein